MTATTLSLPGLQAPVEIYRDRLGIPHIKAAGTADAFFAQGFAHAQDRMWQMDSDRLRASGRWAEIVGHSAVDQDMLYRRMRLAASSESDYQHLKAETRDMLDAYCAGVNAFLTSTDRLPAEYGLLGRLPEPWRPWDGLMVYKVRHVLMGVWEGKAWRAKLLQEVGAEGMAALYPQTGQGEPLILPPGGTYDGSVASAIAELTAVMAALGQEDGGGSNNWVVDGRRTASGKPLLAGDPHRAVDVPNVYYQNHLACPAFDVIGLSFPGLPAFPHFGHNDAVAWCITHTGADTQDLFVERFDPQNPTRYRFGGEWRQSEVSQETIQVQGANPVSFDVVVTHNGPVIVGDPASGSALTMRYTATLGQNSGWDCLLPMLRSRSCAELDGLMRDWVDPVNNLLYADIQGNIGYRTRGHVPMRSSQNGWLPVPGWSGEYDWQGNIPFEELPAAMNPPEGYVVTANNRVVGADYKHYMALFFASEFRALRITERLQAQEKHTVESMAAIHADVVSLPAKELLSLLDGLQPRTEMARQALGVLRQWDAQVKADAVAPTIANVTREELLRLVLRPLVGQLEGDAFNHAGRGAPSMVAMVRNRIFHYAAANDRRLLPQGGAWPDLLTEALERAVAKLQASLGGDMAEWRWGRVHQVKPGHLLASAFPAAGPQLSPPASGVDGDGDTVRAASYTNSGGFTVTGTSVARYVFDLADWDRSAWVVPYGASGHPGSAHLADQHQAWVDHKLYPMLYTWEKIQAEAESRQQLLP